MDTKQIDRMNRQASVTNPSQRGIELADDGLPVDAGLRKLCALIFTLQKQELSLANQKFEVDFLTYRNSRFKLLRTKPTPPGVQRNQFNVPGRPFRFYANYFKILDHPVYKQLFDNQQGILAGIRRAAFRQTDFRPECFRQLERARLIEPVRLVEAQLSSRTDHGFVAGYDIKSEHFAALKRTIKEHNWSRELA